MTIDNFEEAPEYIDVRLDRREFRTVYNAVLSKLDRICACSNNNKRGYDKYSGAVREEMRFLMYLLLKLENIGEEALEEDDADD